MFNLNNYSVATGRLTADPFVYQNTDGSQKVRITLATNDNYKNADGKRSTQFLPFEAFIPADRNPGVYTMIHSGDKISIAYTVKNNNYRDKNTNEMIYGIVLQIEKISLEESAKDESVVSIKMTLYRLADKSQIVDALVEAAENGKEVVVFVELRARFDEESNIEYSRKLEEAGCRVIYGLNGYKVHSKLCLISRKTENGVSYITQIGTGNYNEKTSALYTDLSLLTGNQEIGKEAAAPVLDEKLKERLDWMFATMMNDDEKGKRLTETGNYADRNLNDVRLNSQEIFYAMAYSNAEKMQKKEKSEK